MVDAGWTLGYCWFDPPSADSQARGNLRFLHQLADWLEPSRPGITPLPNHIGPTSGTDILVTDVSVDSSGVLLFNLLTPKPGIRYLIEGTTDFKIWNLLTTFIADTRATRITSVVDADRPNFFRIRADSVAEAFLRFPLLGGNPFNAPVTALFDHSPALGVVVAYNGERGDDAGSRVERAAGTGYGQSPPPGSSCPCSTTMLPSG